MVPWVHLSPNPQGLSIGSAVFAQLATESRCTLQGAAHFPPLKLPLPMGDLNSIKYMVFGAHPNPQPKRHLDRFCRFGRPFVKRFALCYRTVVLAVCPVCLSVCPVLSVCRDGGVLWPNGWMDQDETWHAGRPRPWSRCVRWGPAPPPQ